MAPPLFCPRLFDGRSLREGVRLRLDGERVAAVEPAAGPAAGDEALPPGSVAAPGLVDLQLNGGGGRLFNDEPGLAALEAIGRAHLRCGTTSWLPTLITDARERIDAAVAAVRHARRELPGVLGLHLEGPFLNPARRGIHRPEHIAAFEPSDVDRLTALGGDGATLVTLAPEQVPAGTVRSLRARGAVVFAGHTAAGFDAVRAALDEGLDGFTHLFNAMPPLSAREPGAVGAALLAGHAWAGLVLDGHHVAPGTVQVLRAARGLSRVLLVSDAMPPAGTEARTFMLQGRRIRVEGGRCVDDDGTLAGASITLADAVRIAIGRYGFAPEEALACASRRPAELLGRDDLGVLRAGAVADLVVFGPAWQPVAVMQRGTWARPPEGAPC